jgi:lipopolysaccharide transport system ATP-binding protein
MPIAISVENLSKTYHLGQIGTGTFSRDLAVWWAKIRGKPNPLLRIGEKDHGNRDGEELWALRGVSFTVQQGEVLGVIGRNGAGKSTVLKILSRVTAPTSGKIKVKGRVASLLEVGTGFHPELTGRENIYLNGAILGMSRREIERKFDEIVDFAEVEKFIDTPVKRYSSGMYVRLAFAVAAHLEPEILVVDEVLAVGDAAFQKKCLGKMGDVASEGRTILFVSHNMGAISRLCTRCVVLNAGYSQFDGDTESAINNYLDSFTSASSWQASHESNTPFHLVSAQIFEDERQIKNRFAIGELIIIEINAINKVRLSSSHIHVLVRFNGLVLFRTFDTDENPDLLLERLPKNHHYFLKINTQFLKPGMYDVSLDTGVQNSAPFEKYNDILTFEIYDPDGDFDRAWSATREGVIRAPVVWEQL